MPADNIKRSIEKATGGGEAEQFEEIVYEGYGPGGVAVLVEAATDNRNRTAAEVRSIFTKTGGQLAGSGAVAWQFEPRGLITVERDGCRRRRGRPGGHRRRRRGRGHATTDPIEIYTEPADLVRGPQGARGRGLTVEDAESAMIAKQTVDARRRPGRARPCAWSSCSRTSTTSSASPRTSTSPRKCSPRSPGDRPGDRPRDRGAWATGSSSGRAAACAPSTTGASPRSPDSPLPGAPARRSTRWSPSSSRPTSPDLLAVERLFFSHERAERVRRRPGARASCCSRPRRRGIPVREATPERGQGRRSPGYGAADKDQVGRMVAVILQLAEVPTPGRRRRRAGDRDLRRQRGAARRPRQRRARPKASVMDRAAVAPIVRGETPVRAGRARGAGARDEGREGRRAVAAQAARER